MMSRNVLRLVPLLVLAAAPTLHAQGHTSSFGTGPQHWLALVELPALLLAVVFSFLTASALRGGRLGTGMLLIAWGFLVMAVGHLHMQLEVLFGINIFASVLGSQGGQVAWILALVVTWVLTGFGFVRLYRASVRV